MLTHRSTLCYLVTVLFLFAAILAGCSNIETGQAMNEPTPSLLGLPSVHTTVELTPAPTPTPVILGPLFDSSIDLMAGPIEVPIELRIPSLKVKAPILGVGLTSNNLMDTPRGLVGDTIWHMGYWYRGSGIPGEPGTATIAGHVNDPLADPEIFADLEDLDPGDQIIIYYSKLDIEIHFTVDQVKVYSVEESSDPAVLAQIFGDGPVVGTGPQPARDGLSHLTLITCAGNIVNGQFDHHTVVYATRSK